MPLFNTRSLVSDSYWARRIRELLSKLRLKPPDPYLDSKDKFGHSEKVVDVKDLLDQAMAKSPDASGNITLGQEFWDQCQQRWNDKYGETK